MKTYTGGRNQYGIWSKNTSVANLSFGDGESNDAYRTICAMKNWPFLERLRTLTTTASTQFKNLPYDCDLVREISVIPVGDTTRYTPRLSPSPAHWDALNLSTFTSNIPEWYIVRNGQVGLWPVPASTGNTIYVNQKCRVIDLSVADITLITVSAIANGATTMTVSGSLTSLMAGMWIRITYTGAANTGDGLWYEIAGITNSTTLELVRAYGGATISAGSAACTIGQVSLLPEAYQATPWKLAAATYWGKESDARADKFQAAYDTDLINMGKSYSSPTTEMVVDDGCDEDIINPNLVIRL